MERGKLLKPELNKAIHDSAISVIVFSNGYASSKWCLDEVMTIIEKQESSPSRHEFVPVFYKVEPSDVRNQTGSFKDAFDVYDNEVKAETNLDKRRELLEKVRAWRESLRKAATFTGLVYKDGYEFIFISKIVNVVKKKLYIDQDKVVGIEDRVDEIEKWLQDPSPNAAILLIAGMGGIGKTTIAKCVYNSNFHNYDGSCFLADIQKTSNQPGGLVRLQHELLSTILKSEKEENIWNVDEGTIKVTNAIFNKKVFLILNDVATIKQLDVLLGQPRFYPGSKVIITTRHTQLLTAFSHPKVQTITTLSMNDAIELFSLHAFNQHRPTKPYIAQSQVFIQRCYGHPLVLKVLGSSLRGKTYGEWEEIMRKLAATPHFEGLELLEISFRTLEHDTDKQLFLHIACFFEGEEKDYIVKLLAGCGLYPVAGIKNLMNRYLVYVEDGRVKMHPMIKEMGRYIVCQESPKEPWKRSRLWNYKDCINLSLDHIGTEKVGLMIDMSEMKEATSSTFEIGVLENMKNLMLLQLNYVTFSGTFKKFPKQLRLLRWHGCPLKAIPSDSSLEKLVVLDMSYSKLERVWYGYKYIGSLKILNLSNSNELTETPDFVGLPCLERLILYSCLALIKVGESIKYLKELVLLDLSYCRSLRDLPRLPTSIVSLKMKGCGAF